MYYDCQICGEKHKLKMTWEKETEEEVEAQWPGLNFEEELMAMVLKSAKETFEEKHPGEEFIEANLKENVDDTQ